MKNNLIFLALFLPLSMSAQSSYPSKPGGGSYIPQITAPAPYYNASLMDTAEWPTVGSSINDVDEFLGLLDPRKGEQWDEVTQGATTCYIAYMPDVRLTFYVTDGFVSSVEFAFNEGREDMAQEVIQSMKNNHFMIDQNTKLWYGRNRNDIRVVVKYYVKQRVFRFVEDISPKTVKSE